MSEFDIFAKSSIARIGALREGVFLLLNIRKISNLLELETHCLQVAAILNSNTTLYLKGVTKMSGFMKSSALKLLFSKLKSSKSQPLALCVLKITEIPEIAPT